MNYLNNRFLWALVALLFMGSCSKTEDVDPKSKADGALMLHFENKFGEKGMALNKEFTTPEGEKISFSRYEYILSNFILKKADGSEFQIPNSYYFMGKGKVNTDLREMIRLSGIPAGDYVSITFSVGVDPKTNTSTDHFEKGELKSDVGMSWSWKTGYKFINWEGSFEHQEKGKLPFYFHIGTNDNYRTVTKNFDKSLTINGAKSSKIHIMVMPNKVFTGFKLNDLELKSFEGKDYVAVMVGPKEKSKQIADNCANMFKLHHVESTGK